MAAKHGKKVRKVSTEQPKKIETNKLMAIYLFVVFNVVMVFSMVAMWHFGNLNYLNVLITNIAGEVLVYAIYCMKAYSAKKEEEKVKLERDKMLFEVPNNESEPLG